VRAQGEGEANGPADDAVRGERGLARTAAWRVACRDLKAFRGAWRPGECTRPQRARGHGRRGDADAEGGAVQAQGAERATLCSSSTSFQCAPCLNAKISKNLNRTPPSFEYESCREHLEEYFP
jgi:hypothetical protein